jgi:energy-coupling factor transporter ATP-binding protein EcfA2
MEIESLQLTNFKRFRNLSIDFKNRATGDIATQFLILGDNGSGKTTVLQAIALCLSLASRRTRSIEDFDWTGWLAGRYERWGRPRIELAVHFSDDEIKATQEAARRWYERGVDRPDRPRYVEPPHTNVVTLRLDGERYSTEIPGQQFLFQGRSYAASLLRMDPSARDLFERLPGIFWFDQFRNLATPAEVRRAEENEDLGDQPSSRISFSVGVVRLREHLNKWKLGKLAKDPPTSGHDFLLELENLYRRVFPGRSFGDPEPMYRGGIPSPADYYFILSDGNRTYDIEEMSAGEQSIFPMLYEFVRQQVKNSVVLIDEVDLNLHPPLAQTLVSLLPQIRPNCQFIYTTHSRAISGLASPEQVHRLEGGQLSL